MNNFRKSTKERPLLFFEYFLQKKNFEKYENDFYANSVNPSFKAYREKGYIEYLDSEYVNRKVEPNRVYLIDRLTIIFNNQIKNSFELIVIWIEEYLNRNENVESYVINQRTKILVLKKNLQFQSSINNLVIEFLDEIEEFLKEYNNKNILGNQFEIGNPIIPTITYFGLSPSIRKSHIEELYETSCELLIIDYEVVSFKTFYEALATTSLIQNINKIVFNVDNQLVAYYFKCLQPYFRNLKHTRIVKSELFLNKRRVFFSTGALDTALTQSKGKPMEILEQIQTGINDIFLESS